MYRYPQVIKVTKFEWDETKNNLNIQKHGIDFNEAVEVFANPLETRRDNRKNYGEQRWNALGTSRGVMLVATYTFRGERIRIISIRRASRYERKAFKERSRWS